MFNEKTVNDAQEWIDSSDRWFFSMSRIRNKNSHCQLTPSEVKELLNVLREKNDSTIYVAYQYPFTEHSESSSIVIGTKEGVLRCKSSIENILVSSKNFNPDNIT